MLQDHIPKIIQAIIALILLILTIVYWKNNHIGANIINFQAVILWIIGLENIIVPLRWYIGKQSKEYEVSLLLFAIFTIGQLFEVYNPSHSQLQFNLFCRYNMLVPLLLNLAFMVLLMFVLILYAIRHVYRLITEQLLSINSNLQPEELNRIMAMRKPFEEIREQNPQVA